MKKNIIKKSMSLFLTLAMVISLIPALTLSASATGPFYTTSTNVGSLVTLTFVQLFGSEAATTYSGDYINIASYSQPTSGVNTAKLLSSDFTTELGYNDPSYGIDTEPDIYFSASTAGVYTFTAAIVDGNNTNNTLLSNTIQVTVTSPTSAPTVTTTGVTTYDATTATTGGNVTDTGTASVTDRGVVYSTTDTTPTIAEGATHDSNGTGTGVFSESVTGLSPNTKYYVCAYATNSVGTSYGTVVNFTTSAISASISPSTTLTEENLDTNSLTVALSGTTFADATLAASNFTLNNAPTGVTVESVSYTDTTHCAVNLAYTGADFDTSVTTFSLTIAAAELASNSALTSGALTITAMVEAAPTVTTVAASSISSAAATLNGTVNANNATSVVTFDYGTSTSYGSSVTAPQSPVTGASATSVSYALTGLVPNTTYHYRVNSVNTVGTSNGSDMTFTTTAIAPTAATVAASNVSSTSATLTGTVNANNATSVVTFDYGTSTSYGSSATAAQSPVTGTSATSVSADLTGLVPNTAYHYRTKSVNAAGTTYGSDLTFTTSAIAPTGTTVAASSISSSAATLNGTVNANNATSVVTFDYGTSTSYGSSATAAQSPVTGTSATSVSSALTGLVPNTTYHYRTKSVNTAGTTYGSDLTFTTSAIAPTAATVAASGVSATSATLNGTVNANNATSVVTFDYGTSMSYGSSATAVQSPVTGTSATSVSATLSGLVPNTTYHYRTKSVNTAGTTYGSDLSFTTPNTAASISPTTALTEENLIGNSLEVTLSGTTFLNSTLDASNFTLNGAPQGVTIGSISYTDATHCTVNLAYDGTDFDSSVANFSLTVKAAVLALGSDLTSGTLTITATIEVAPTVTTASVSPYTATTATMAGNVTISGGESVTDRGVVYSTTDTTPTITEGATKDSNGIGTGSFSKSISSLLPNTTYYVCAYATNSVGTAYGSVVTFTTSDTYTIGSVANQTLTALTAGYSSGTQDTKTVTITKTGTGTLSNLAVALSGTNASSFTITQPTVTTLNSSTTSTTFTVKANDALSAGTYTATLSVSADSMTAYTFTVTQVISSAYSGGGSSGSASTTTPATPSTVVEVNGEKQTAGTSTTTTNTSGQTLTTVTVDTIQLEKILEAKGENAVVTIPVASGSDVVSGVLTGQMVNAMEENNATLVIQTDSASYTLPAAEINIAAVSEHLGTNVALSNIQVQISIAEPSAQTIQVVESAASSGNYQIVVQPVDFAISCTYNGKTVDVSDFNSYVERTIAIPDGVDPTKITTGVVVEPDGTTRHVPTRVTQINGKYYAVINSLTNSTYTVVWNPITFADSADNWAKDAINDMGSRMVITGYDDGTYRPDANITRAEFAAIIVKALGLEVGTGDSKFSDVGSTDWYSGYVETAASYGLITGYEDGTFRPNEEITREQAMVIIARAMELTGLKTHLTDSQICGLLGSFEDSNDVSGYAESGIAACVEAGLVSGRTSKTVNSQDNITRAEVATIVQRLLQKSELI